MCARGFRVNCEKQLSDKITNHHSTQGRRKRCRISTGAMPSKSGPAWSPAPRRSGGPSARPLQAVPEKGASLRVLRPSKFVQGDETLWLENTQEIRRRRPASRSASTARAGKTCGRNPRSPRMSARARTSSMAGTTTRTSIRTSCVDLTDLGRLSRQEVWRLVRRLQEVRHAATASGSRCRSAPPAPASSIASPG